MTNTPNTGKETAPEADRDMKEAGVARASVSNMLAGDGGSKAPEKIESRVEQRAREILEGNPKQMVKEIASNLKRYIRMRILSEAGAFATDLPYELAEEISWGNPLDEFIDEVNNDPDFWDDLQAQYGPSEETPEWTVNELKELLEKLK